MDSSESDRIAWAQHWTKVGPLLDAHSKNELQNMGLKERQQQIKNLLDLAWQFRQERTDSGLVELKRKLARIFSK